jgi:hypothetical protein
MARMLASLISPARAIAACIAFTLETIIVAFRVLVSPSSANATAFAVAVSCSMRLDAADSDLSSIDANGTIIAPNSVSNLTMALTASSASLLTDGSRRIARSTTAGVTAAKYGPATFRRAEFDIEELGSRDHSTCS